MPELSFYDKLAAGAEGVGNYARILGDDIATEANKAIDFAGDGLAKAGKSVASLYEKRPTDVYSLYSGLRSVLQENPNAAYARSLAKSYGMGVDQGSAKRDFADMQHANMIEQKKLQSDKEMLDKIMKSRDDQTSYLKEVVKALNNYKSR